MARRVVVTGLGAVSPVGNDIPTMWQNMLGGVNGIREIDRFDTSDLKVHIAGLVRDFAPERYFEKREAKKLDLYCQYAIAAAQQAVDDSGILGKIDEERLGVYIGAGIGGLETFVNNTVGLDHGGSRKVSPFFIPMMIGNIATGNVAIRFKAKGVSLSVMSACASGTNSVGEADAPSCSCSIVDVPLPDLGNRIFALPEMVRLATLSMKVDSLNAPE